MEGRKPGEGNILCVLYTNRLLYQTFGHCTKFIKTVIKEEQFLIEELAIIPMSSLQVPNKSTLNVQ